MLKEIFDDLKLKGLFKEYKDYSDYCKQKDIPDNSFYESLPPKEKEDYDFVFNS